MSTQSVIKYKILELLAQKKAVKLTELIASIENSLEDGDRKTPIRYTVTRDAKILAGLGEIILLDIDGVKIAKITNQGRQSLRSMKLGKNTHMMHTAWDGKWRIAILNIPEADKETRNALRYFLKKASFVCLKNSVWISPYPFEHMLARMKDDLSLTHELMIIVSDMLDHKTEQEFRECYTDTGAQKKPFA
jgi:DNA-binding transcriptional regulator PaaX